MAPLAPIDIACLEPAGHLGVSRGSSGPANAAARSRRSTPAPGIPTERNALRLGFHVAYTKAILVQPGEGLARSV